MTAFLSPLSGGIYPIPPAGRYRTGRDSMQKLVGVEADHDIVHEVTDIIARYEPENVHLDWLRCYHLGNAHGPPLRLGHTRGMLMKMVGGWVGGSGGWILPGGCYLSRPRK